MKVMRDLTYLLVMILTVQSQEGEELRKKKLQPNRTKAEAVKSLENQELSDFDKKISRKM